MKLEDIIAQAKDTVSVTKVYGEPYQQNGVTLIPAASIRGGFGGGEGEGREEGEEATFGTGQGGGGGVIARPIGAYKIQGNEVEWVPATDVTRVVVMAQVVSIVALMVIRSVLRSRRKTA